MARFSEISKNRILRDELAQSFIRIGFIVLVFTVLVNAEKLGSNPSSHWHYLFMALFTVWSLGYCAYIKRYPSSFQRQRIFISALADSAMTALMFIVVGELSALFPVIFLWLIVGYGMRYGTEYAKVVLIVTTVCWAVVYILSPYWHDHPHHSMGWLAAFWLIPLYYFVLVRRLHTSLADLHSALKRTEHIANYDNLTQLANRSFFNIELDRFVATYDRLAVVIMDLDGFKKINDTYGHAAGDEVLIGVATLLKEISSSNVIAGRLGGDEFILSIGDLDKLKTEQLCQQLLKKIDEESHAGRAVTASVGISFYPFDSDDISQVKGFADAAMYQAKQQGKNRCVFFQPQVDENDVSV